MWPLPPPHTAQPASTTCLPQCQKCRTRCTTRSPLRRYVAGAYGDSRPARSVPSSATPGRSRSRSAKPLRHYPTSGTSPAEKQTKWCREWRLQRPPAAQRLLHRQRVRSLRHESAGFDNAGPDFGVRHLTCRKLLLIHEPHDQAHRRQPVLDIGLLQHFGQGV